MIKITIGKKKFAGAYSWNDITLSKYCDLAAIPIPEGYKDFIIADGKFSIDNPETVDEYVKAVTEITPKQLNEIFPAYYRKVIYCLSDIPEGYDIPKDLVNDLYEYYFKPFVASLLYHTPLIHFLGQLKNYEPHMIQNFKIGHNRYYLPETLNILGQDVPMANEPIITYTEASDIFRGMKLGPDDIHKLALFMAIYCRKKGEQYDERKVIERKELFIKAPMAVVWSVFFCTIKRLPEYILITRLFGSLPKSLKETVSQVQTYQDTAAGDLSLKLQATEASGVLK